MKIQIKHIILLAIIFSLGSCKTSSQINEGNYKSVEFIEDLRDIIRIGGKRTKDDKLLILNVRGKQTVFEITESNANALSNIKHSLIKDISITRNYDGNFDTKYNTIIIMTLRRSAFKILKNDLKKRLK